MAEADAADGEKRKSHGGVAFEVILKPATSDTPHLPSAESPTKEKREITQEDIDRKLKEAEERRLSVEASKLHLISKEKEKIQEVSQKAHELNESFAKDAEKKLKKEMEAFEENKKAQELAKQERLKEHDKHVQEVREKKMSQSEDPS
jgi:stathmin